MNSSSSSVASSGRKGAQSSSSSVEPVDAPKTFILLSYRGTNHELELDPNSTTLAAFQEQIYNATGVLSEHQKIVSSNSTVRSVFTRNSKECSSDGSDRSLLDLGFPTQNESSTPLKLMLVGPKSIEIEAVRQEDEQGAKMNRPRQYHPSMLRGTRPRPTASSSSTATNPFHAVRVHKLTPPSAPEHDLVLSRLKQLSNDEAVVHVCRLHGFQVGELTELLPHEHPHLLGLNENQGQRISLRLRTDRYDGLQPYRETRRVLLHELAHNKINDHPPEFKTLNSQLNAQVEAFERAKREGTHTLIEGEVYVPASDGNQDEAQESTTHVLGGSEPVAAGPQDAASRRARVLEATMRRLEKAEAEIERGCGSSTSSSRV